jgi:hypothetical protein
VAKAVRSLQQCSGQIANARDAGLKRRHKSDAANRRGK